ncbi:alpha-hydroxy acid oxidase [Planktotalea sp.]|uniref:alpha-hydroxy acid oxidase n=1 Tax=Planktotalea sp. TaxID=2029877 RepID=UPI0025F3D513|nr:alpha-hydroxy acid oxidase [Planktotalea sp.]
MDLHSTYPAISDLRHRARARIPHFVWEYLDSATGHEATKARNRTKLDEVLMMPSVLHGEMTPDLSVDLMGQHLPLPFGIAPVGMSGLIWPDAECHLARAAADLGIPYSLSTVATQTPEMIEPVLGAQGWFQMYPPRDAGIRADMLARAKKAGFHTLILTVDVPVASRRERQLRGGLQQPPKITPRLLAQVAKCPAWALGTAHLGMPRMRLMDSYADHVKGQTEGLSSTAHVGYLLRTSPDWDYVSKLRDEWDGSLVVKGVLNAADVAPLEKAGVDAIWLSNHAGRQFDAAPSPIEVLPAIRAATKLPLIFDSGIEGGLDMLRAIALGADFVMMGRAWHYALGALGADGPAHLADMLTSDLIANMGQLGARRLNDVRGQTFTRTVP